MFTDNYFSDDDCRSLVQKGHDALEQKNFDDAEVFFKEALHCLQKALGPNHIEIAMILHNLSALYEKAGRAQEAELLGRRVSQIMSRARKPEPESNPADNSAADKK